jgi:hypothetical protein
MAASQHLSGEQEGVRPPIPIRVRRCGALEGRLDEGTDRSDHIRSEPAVELASMRVAQLSPPQLLPPSSCPREEVPASRASGAIRSGKSTSAVGLFC